MLACPVLPAGRGARPQSSQKRRESFVWVLSRRGNAVIQPDARCVGSKSVAVEDANPRSRNGAGGYTLGGPGMAGPGYPLESPALARWAGERASERGQLPAAAAILQETSCAPASRGCPASGRHWSSPPPPPPIKYVEEKDLRVGLGAVGWSLWERELGVFLKTCPDKVLPLRRNPHTHCRNPVDQGCRLERARHGARARSSRGPRGGQGQADLPNTRARAHNTHANARATHTRAHTHFHFQPCYPTHSHYLPPPS